MSSDRKIDANRANAQHSTGPVTDEGKAASSQNARQHGLSAKSLFIPETRIDEFHALQNAFFAEVRPVGELQIAYFEQLIHAAWNLTIARELHAAALHNLDDRKISNAARYIAQFERSFAQAHKALKDEQTDLALRAMSENEPIADLPIPCRIKVIGNEATKIARQAEPALRPTRRTAVLAAIGHAFRPTPPTAAVEHQDIAA
jgi:hypothetical protein